MLPDCRVKGIDVSLYWGELSGLPALCERIAPRNLTAPATVRCRPTAGVTFNGPVPCLTRFVSYSHEPRR